MHNRIFLTVCLIVAGFASQAQSLGNAQLIKLYGLMIDAIKHPKPQIAEATRVPFNKFLSDIDHNWLQLSLEDKIVNDDEMWFTYNHYTGKQVTAFLTPTYQVINRKIQAKLEYYSPYASPFNISQAQITSLGEVISRSNNAATGKEATYQFMGFTFVYASFPPKKDGFKLYGKPVTLYKITVSKDI